MLFGSRVSSAPDTSRIGEGLKRPGMDTRQWLGIGHVVAFNLDDEEGPLVDVEFTGSGTITDSGQEHFERITARLGSFYAGPGFGFYAPLDIDDEVVVSIPDGDPSLAVIIARTWSRSDPPPDTAKNHKADVCLHIKKDVNLRIQSFGQGKIVVAGEDGKVYIGAEEGTQPIALGEEVKSWLDTIKAKFNAHTHTVSAGVAQAVTPPMQIYPDPPIIPGLTPPEVRAEKGEVK